MATEPTQIPKLQSKEVNSDGRPINLPGVYKHKDLGMEIITSPGEEGILQADALMAPQWEHAWEWIKDVPTRQEILAMQKAQALKDAEAEKNGKIKTELLVFADKE